MQLPIKAHYATLAMLTLATQYASGHVVTSRALADEHIIPAPFLVQILQQLRAAGMITSTRGSSGGFRLERSPSAISMADIIDAVCPSAQLPINRSPNRLNSVVHELWAELNALQSCHLRQTKLSDLCDRAESPAQAMSFSI